MSYYGLKTIGFFSIWGKFNQQDSGSWLCPVVVIVLGNRNNTDII